MNYKAFVLGAAVGFLFTLSPACGPAECDGCIDADGTCIEPGQTSQSQCGADGVVCIACMANQTCNSAGLCENIPPVATDGGTDGGDGGENTACNASNCNGCCAGDICLPGTSSSNCGTAGGACGACTTPAICQVQGAGQGGTCVTPPPANYGEACTANADCSSIGNTALCKKTTRPGEAEYPDGYCTKICGAKGTPCGAGSMCISIPASWGEFDRLCLETCTPGSTTDCRTGYSCIPVGSTGNGVCWIDPVPSFDAGIPAPDDVIGGACTTDVDCNPGDFDKGLCFAPVDENMQPSGWPLGYCTADCTELNDVCGNTGMCLGINQQGDALCFDKCAEGGAGQSDCRTDYVCEHYLRGLPDGGQEQSTDGYCSPNCNAPGVGCGSGTTCTPEGYCE